MAMEKGCYFPRGKMLGGSSSMNLFMYVRGNQRDYDRWVELGNVGWDSANVWEFFKKSESNTFKPFLEGVNGEYHSDKGPLKVSFCNVTPPYEKLFIEANAEFGLPYTLDVNGNVHIGTMTYQGTIYNGYRESTAAAFLAPVKDRSNLHVIKRAFVEKILVDANNCARGVQYTYKGRSRRVAYARKEVILSAGTYMSPVILMHSGIGPTEQLQKFRISPKVELSVGENLLDHIGSMIFYAFDATFPSTTPTNPLDAVYNLAIHNIGDLAIFPQQGAFLNSHNTSKTLPDTQISFVYFTANSSAIIKAMFASFGVRQEFIQQLIRVNRVKDVAVNYVVLLHPKSRGFVRLNGTSVYDKPIINPNYLVDPDDLDGMVTSMQRQIALQNTKTFRKVGGKVLRIALPECDKFAYLSRRYLKCYAKYFTSTAYHPAGSCKMGPAWDAAAVVDPRLRVYNVHGLRVIDASV